MRNQLSSDRIGTLLVFVLAIVFANRAMAFDGLCSHCGGKGGCQKVCRLVCEEKKVPVTCWSCKTEDFCAPGPSHPGCKHSEWVCDDGDPKAPCVKPQKFVWTEWIPGNCGKIYSKHKLMRKTIDKKVPSYKWVVEDLCSECEDKSELATIAPDADIPPVPLVDAKIIYGRTEVATVQVDQLR